MTVIRPGAVIRRGQTIPFGPKNRRARLTLQNDGNLVLYAGTFPMWNAGPNPAIAKALMQTDGNFVLYDAGNGAKWATETAGHPGAHILLQDDGNMVLYQGARALWSTNTAGWTRRVHHSPFENLSPAKLISAAADVVSAVGPFVDMAVSLVPGAGQLYNAAKAAVNVGIAFAKGRPLTDAFIDAAVGMLPGGAVAQRAARAVVSVAKGRSLTGELLDQVKEQFPGAEHAIAVTAGIMHGRNLQDAAIDEVKSMAADQIKALKVPLPSGIAMPVEMKNGAEIGYGVLHSKTLTPAAALAVRAKLAPNAQRGFDRVMSMRALKHARRGSPHAPKPLPSFKGATFVTSDGRAVRIGNAWLV